jgi:murein L,D-transpeptidase YcbB/YkuD
MQVGADLSDPLARRFYEQRSWRAAWTPDQAQTLDQAIAQAPRHGLNPSAFAQSQVRGATPARQDVSLTLAALAYAKALASGFVDPPKIEDIFTLERNTADIVAGLEQALATGSLATWLASLAPADGEYQMLSTAYLSALGQSGLPAAPAQGAPIGTSLAPSDRARQLAANLERRRWLVRTPPATRMDVNTAGAFLGYFRPGTPVLTVRTVAGRDDHPTPSIQGPFRRLIANPPWRVPTRIAKKEILPKGSGYLRRQHMRWVEGRLEQAPGPQCALGLVKFDVEDPYDIYLHDTPAKTLFAAPERHRSHGCVRVENAVAVARLIAGQNGQADAFDQALASGETTQVDLGEAIAVRMLYHTAFLDEGGQVLLAPDVYGTDDTLAAALGFGQAAAAVRRREPSELVGP